MRKVLQIATSSSDDNGDTIYALCEDGSMWLLNDWDLVPKNRWRRLPDIPVPSINRNPKKSFTTAYLEAVEERENNNRLNGHNQGDDSEIRNSSISGGR